MGFATHSYSADPQHSVVFHRSTSGGETQEVLSSVIKIARLGDLHPRDALVDVFRVPQPIVAPALATVQ